MRADKAVGKFQSQSNWISNTSTKRILELANGAAPAGGLVEVIDATRELAEAVGPGWGITILVVILLFMPQIGVLVHLAKLAKEDRADARKRKLETERLEARYRNRSKKSALPKPYRNEEEQG